MVLPHLKPRTLLCEHLSAPSLSAPRKRFDEQNRNYLDRSSDWCTKRQEEKAEIQIDQEAKRTGVKLDKKEKRKMARKQAACCFLRLPFFLIIIAVIGTIVAAKYGLLSNKMGVLLVMFVYLVVACCVGVARYSDVVRDYVQRDLPEQWAYDEEKECKARCCIGSALFLEKRTTWMKTMIDLDAYRNAKSQMNLPREPRFDSDDSTRSGKSSKDESRKTKLGSENSVVLTGNV